jgi:hypothetical protein
MTEKHPMCAGCQFGPTPDYTRGGEPDKRAHAIAASLLGGDTLGCHRRDHFDPHFDPNQTVPASVCGGASRIRDARQRP